jgi:hypothetical protein
MKVSFFTGKVFLCVSALVLLAATLPAEPPSGPFKITVADGKVVTGEAILPVDPLPRIAIGGSGPLYFGLAVDGKRITCSPQGSIWSTLRVDGQMFQPNFRGGIVANKTGAGILPPGPFGRKRLGQQTDVQYGKIHVTQTVEIIPSKPAAKAATLGQKRSLDTCRISYLVHNQDTQPHKIDYRASIDILIVNNDGALYASPSTHPGQILNGVVLEDKTLPTYLQVLERPNLADPGFIATMTFKNGKAIGPNRVVLSNLGAVSGFGQQMWEIAAQPAGDSACAIYWNGHTVKAGEKIEFVWAYGGGLASDPENEGKVLLGLGGSLEPHKLFTITATVVDPVPNQALTLELPAGIDLVEGPLLQAVPLPGPDGNSLVLWKSRVRLVGDYQLKVHSSTGTIQAKHVTIEPNLVP